MGRYKRGKVSLYELMMRSGIRHSYGKRMEKLHSEISEEDRTTGDESDEVRPEKAVQWWRKPRTVQFNAGRIEFSLSYPVVIALILGIILLVLLAFRGGQYYSYLSTRGGADARVGVISEDLKKTAGAVTTVEQGTAGASPDVSAEGRSVESVKSKGDNVIVLVEYPKRTDLVPVQEHFAQYGIATEIVNWGGKYFLITKDRYGSFGPGSDGYKAQRRIVAVGAQYKGKAPEGCETFAPHFFKDAYGRKIK